MNIVRDKKDLQKVIDFISKEPILAFDIETTGLNVRRDTIIGFGVSNKEEGFYLVHKEWIGGQLVENLSVEQCREVLLKIRNKKLITFNGSFDLRFTKNYFSIDLLNSLWSEAMLAKHTVEEERPFRLKEVAALLFGENAKEEQTLMKQSIKNNGGSTNEFFKADTNIMAKYCVADCILTFKINEHYLKKIKEEGLIKFFFEDEVMPLYKEVTIPMESNGIDLDMDLLTSSREGINKDIELLEDQIQSMIAPHLEEFREWFIKKDYPVKRTGAFAQTLAKVSGLDLPLTSSGNFSMSQKALESLPPSHERSFLLGDTSLRDDLKEVVQSQMHEDSGIKYMFNLKSKHHLKKLFFDKFREQPLSKTEKGNPQCNEDFLELVENRYDFVPLLLVYNKLNKINGSYIERFYRESEEGKFYPSFFQHRTISGRYGSDLQQLNRPIEQKELDEGNVHPLIFKYNNVVRKLFISGESSVFVDADYESLEPHTFAHVAGDSELKNIFSNGDDFYSTIAILAEDLKGVSANKKADNYLGKELSDPIVKVL
jgi:DNA polymerase I-like protein with 3'-5' exonuclease and polymerase domains